MSHTIEIAVYGEQDNERIAEVYDYVAHAGSKDHFSKSFGNWLPGDPPEFYVEGSRWQDTGQDLTEAEWAKYGPRIEDQAYEIVSEEAA